MRIKTFVATLATLVLVSLAATAVGGEQYRRIAHLRALNNTVRGMQSLPDGEHYTTLNKCSVVRHAYAQRSDSTTLARFDFAVGEYALSHDERYILAEVDSTATPIYRHSYTSDVVLRRTADSTTLRTFSAVRDFSFTPDAKSVIFSRANNLYLYDIVSDSERAITTDGEWNSIINGTTDWVYEEEYGFTRAYACSPDARQIAYLKFDEREVPMFEMMRYGGSLHNRAQQFKYPKAGDKNSTVEVWIYDTQTAQSRRCGTCTERDIYIPDLRWTPDGRLFYYRVNRLQNLFEVVLLHNDGTDHIIYSERSPQYVERPDASTVTFIDGDRFVVREQTTTGWWHLYLHSVERGRLHAITSGKWDVTQVVGTDSRRIYYLATQLSRRNRNFYSTTFDGRTTRTLGTDDGTYTITPSAGMRYYAAAFTAVATPKITTLHRSDGRCIDTLRDNRRSKLASEAAALPLKEFRTFCTERGDTLDYYIQLPPDFDPSHRYPVLLTQYSGPASQQVRNRFTVDMEEAAALSGVVVVCADGRGTGCRGEAFTKCTYRQLGKLETEDQLSFARYIAAQPYADPARIGIYGWSYGGFMALNCAIEGNGMFRVAIAVAPVTSWRFYDSIYTETYNGLPQDNADGYDLYSPLTRAARFDDTHTRLLIMHGSADDNVHLQNTMEMCRALNRAGKKYDMMIYPDQNHSMRPDDMVNIRQTMVDYIVEHL